MKYLSFLLVLFLFSCNTRKEKLEAVIIPKPNKIEVNAGELKFEGKLKIGFNNPQLKSLTYRFVEDLKETCTIQISDFDDADVKLELTSSNNPEESYSLNSSQKEVQITASSEKGMYYGLQTLRQLLLFAENENGTLKLPVLNISDSPRFAWRGIMLDESRYFFGIEKVKQLLDFMALHKLNVFHWHLTDVPGWRIEIKKYPKLATIGGLGNDIDKDAPAQFYTQEQIREIVKYASDRFIEVIPEIDMPGHAKAANRAYPEFSGGGSKSHPEFTFNPGYEGTYAYLTNILKEVVELFPSKYIHLGGDEVHFGNESWNTNPHVLNLMQQQKLTNLREVESYFIHRMADSIKMLDRTVIGWDEIVDFGLDKENSLVMWWRHDKTNLLENTLNNDYTTILCPRIPLYFDFDQLESHKNGRKWGGAFSPMEMVYNFPPDTLPGFLNNTNFVEGIQANIWTERIQSEQRLDYMTFPRLCALAEAGWTNKETKNLDNFKQRLKSMLTYLDNQGIKYYNPFAPETTPEPPGEYRRK